MIRRPPRSTLDRSSAASDVYKRQLLHRAVLEPGVVVVRAEDAAAELRVFVERGLGRVRLDLVVLVALAREDDDVVRLQRIDRAPELHRVGGAIRRGRRHRVGLDGLSLLVDQLMGRAAIDVEATVAAFGRELARVEAELGEETREIVA